MMISHTDKLIRQANKNRQTLWSIPASFLMGAVIGIAVFIYIYGTKILCFTNEDWLLTGWYDLSQHHLGWKLFRSSSWHFPIGLCDNSFFPYKMSIIYTDSIPLLCVLCKPFSNLLPESFQFLGVYGLFCFAMQGGFAKLILRKFLDKEWHCNVGILLYLFNAAFLQRIFVHTALGSHYLILAAITLILYSDSFKKTSTRIILWTTLGILCVSIHFTVFGIVSVLLLGYAVEEALLTNNRIRSALIRFLSFIVPYVVLSAAVFWILGGFYGGIEAGSDGLGDYSANLNALINPLDYSRILKELPTIACQYEGLSYLGIAAIILLIVGGPALINNLPYHLSIHRARVVNIMLTNFLLWFIALSPKVTLGDIILFEEKWPDWVLNSWSMFRSSGRFLWPIMYVLIALALAYGFKQSRNHFSWLLIILVLMQLYELGDIVKDRQYTFKEPDEPYFSAQELEAYDLKGMKHLQFMHPYYFGEYYGDEIRDQMIGYTQYALSHHMTVSNFHFSRDDMEKLEQQISLSLSELESGNPREDTLYVFKAEDFWNDDIMGRAVNVKYIFTDTEVIAYKE